MRQTLGDVARRRRRAASRSPSAARGLGGAPATRRRTKVTLQLKWVPQAQFAGYYAAQDRATTRRPGST